MKKALRTPADGANAERQAIRAKVRRMLATADAVNLEMEGTGLGVQAGPLLTELVEWIGKRDERYNRRPGGLGKRESGKTVTKVARATTAYIAQLETPQVIVLIDSLYDQIDELQAR